MRASLSTVATVTLLAGCQYEAPEYRDQGPLSAEWNAEAERQSIATGPPTGPESYMQGMALRPIAPPPMPPACVIFEQTCPTTY